MMKDLNTVNIRPGVNVLSVLPHLNYKPWFALAEFVDNSIQSSIDNLKDLKRINGEGYKLKVVVDFDSLAETISIRDNAAGIAIPNYQRAFRPAEIPPNSSGLSEFGMGMKSAACWFSPNWNVRSSAIGENTERTVIFNVDEIVNDSLEDLNVLTSVVGKNSHYTVVSLEKIRHFPKGRTISKIKNHLASIYRIYIREKSLILKVNGEVLKYEDPELLLAPYYKTPEGEKILWKKELNIDLGDGKSATGFIAIRKVASTKLAGLAVFRRKRLIMGSVDETYRPIDIFGSSNTYPYQRVFGEIHLKGFHVSHTKDGIKWDECEDEFLDKVRKIITNGDAPLLQQSREYRSNSTSKPKRKDVSIALGKAASSLKGIDLLKTVNQANSNTTESSSDSHVRDSKRTDTDQVTLTLNFRHETWKISIQTSYVDDGSDFLSIQSKPSIKDPEPREIIIRLNICHPFMIKYSLMDSESLSAIFNIAAAMSLAEVVASELGDENPAVIRTLTNEIIRNQTIDAIDKQ